MKTLSKFALPALLMAGGLASLHGSALALTTEHATICTPDGNINQSGFYSFVTGSFNYSGSNQTVLCPIVRTVAAPAAGYAVWVDGAPASAGPVICTLYSYNYTGVLLGSVSFNVPATNLKPPPRFDLKLTLPQAQVPTYSAQVLSCLLPDQAGIYDIEPEQ